MSSRLTAFNHGWIVNIDFDRKPDRQNAVIIRVWLTKPPRPQQPVLSRNSDATRLKIQPATKTKAATKTKKAAKKRPKRRP